MKIFFDILKYLFMILIATTIVGSLVGAGVFIYFSKGLPSIITTEDYKPMVVTRILGKGGVVVGEFFEERRYIVPLEQIPQHVQRAFIAAEDDRFFEHQGIDLQGILRAAIANAKAGRVVQGGSTITQQVAKSLLLTPERSFFRKMKEIILASRMEKNLNKKQILYLYLNQIYLGNGAYGVEAAARVYFNKEAKDLSIAEGAVLAGLPQAPSKYSPLINAKSAKQRQLYVLRRMMEDRTITKEQMEDAAKQPIKIYFPKDLNDEYAPYYVEHIRKHLLEKFGKEGVYKAGLTAYTPIDPRLSIVATRVIQEGLRNVDKRQGYRGPIRKSKSLKEIEKNIEETSEYNLAQKFPYKILAPDGTHTRDLKARLGSLSNDLEAFEENHIYQGVVLSVDDAKKEAKVQLGLIQGTIPLEKMKWAQPVKAPSSTGTELINRPSQALSKGDVIWVKLLSKNGKSGPVLSLEQEPLIQGSLLSMDTLTGEVMTMVGGYDFKSSEFNRAVQAERQAGSTYKAVIYAAAIDKGYTPATIIQDSPIIFNGAENEKWKPENFEEKFYGDTIFRSALIRSRNIPTIKIVQDIQIPYLINYSKRLGFPDRFNNDYSIALGSTTTSLLDLCRIYSIFPRGGRKIAPIFVNKVVDREGKTLEENKISATVPPLPLTLPPFPKPVNVAGELQVELKNGITDSTRGIWTPDPADPDRVMDPRTAYVMTHLMNEVATVGTGHDAKALGRPAAGKTGTTNDYLDAWFMGFLPQMTTGVWVGFDTQKSIGPKSTGALIALPIWIEYMKEAQKNYPEADFQVPKGVSFAFIDSRTGKLTSANRPNAIHEAFITGTEPGSSSSVTIGSSNGKNTVNGAKTNAPPPQDAPTGNFFKEDIQ